MQKSELNAYTANLSCAISDFAGKNDEICSEKFEKKANRGRTPVFVMNQATGKTRIVYRVLQDEFKQVSGSMLLLHQGRALHTTCATLEAAGISANSTLTISSPPLVGGSQVEDAYLRSVEDPIVDEAVSVTADLTDDRKYLMTVQDATSITQHKVITFLNKELQKKSAIMESDADPKIAAVEIALGNSLAWLKESTYKNQTEFIKSHDRIRRNLKTLTNYMYQEKKQVIQDFADLPKHQMSLENLIGKLDFQDSFNFFISLQPEYLCIGQSTDTDFGLTAEQRTLLEFIRSFKGQDISMFFAKVFTNKKFNNSNLVRFTENLQKEFKNEKAEQKKLNLMRQTASDRLKLVLFSSYTTQEKVKLYRSIIPSENNTFFTLLALCDDQTIVEWLEKVNDAKVQHEFEAWKAIYQATGESPQVDYQALQDAGSRKISKRDGLDNFLFQDVPEDTNREINQDDKDKDKKKSKHINVGLQRVIDMPYKEQILDQFTRFRDDEAEIVKLQYSRQRADMAFTIDQFYQIEESRDLNEGYHLEIIQYCRTDKKSKTILSMPINQPLKFNDSCSNKNDDTYLFQGQDGDMFWFCRDKKKNIVLNLLQADSIHPVQYEINKDSELSKHMLENRFSKVQSRILYYYATAVPRLITIGEMKLVAFSQHNLEMPTVQFYDLEKGMEIVKVQNAEMFLHYFGKQPGSEDVYQIFFKADPVVCGYQNEIKITFEQRINKLKELIENKGPGYQDMKLININFTEAKASSETQIYDFTDESNEAEALINQVSSDQRKSLLINELDPQKPAVKVFSSARSCGIQQFAICYQQELIMYEVKLVDEEPLVKTVPSGIVKSERESEKVQLRIISQRDGSINLVMFKSEEESEKDIETSIYCVHYQSMNSSAKKNSVVFRRNIKQHRNYLVGAQEVDEKVFNVDLIDEAQELKELQIFPEGQASKVDLSASIKIAKTSVRDVKSFRQNQKFQVQLVSKEPLRNWRVTVDHPLVFFYNIQRRNEFFVYSLVEQEQDLVLFRFNDFKIITTEQTQGSQQSPASEFIVLGQGNDDKLITVNIKMDKPFEKEALCSYLCWNIAPNEHLNTPFPFTKVQKAILQDKIEIKKIFLFQGGNPKLTAAVCIAQIANEAMIKLILQSAPTAKIEHHRPSEVALVDKKTTRMCNIYPVRLQNGLIYFVEQDLKTQKYYLVELKLSFSDVYHRWDYSTKRVFGTFQELCNIQIVRDNDQKQDYDYDYNGDLKMDSIHDYYVDKQLFLLQADLTKMIKIQKNPQLNKFQIVHEIDLKEVTGLADTVQKFTQSFLSMSISERAIVIGDQVFVIKSGQQYPIFQQEQPQNQYLYHQTCPVPQSDYLMTRRTYRDNSGNSYLSFVFENDPSRRNRSIIGVRHLRNLISLHIISPKLMLARFGKGFEDQYWSLLTSNGRVAEIGYDLVTKLNSQKWQKVQSCFIKGRICKILLQCKNEVETFVEILEVSNTGELIRATKHEFVNKAPKPQHKEVFMNWKGELLEVHINKVTKSIIDVKRLKSEEKQLVTITTAKPGTYFVYTANYLCWLSPEDTQIRFVLVEDSSQVISTIPLQEIFSQLSRIEEDGLKEKIIETPIIMDSIEPFMAAKSEASGKLDPETLQKHSNRLQVMIKDEVKILILKKEEGDDETQNQYELAEELLATESLLDPQLYVSTEHVCATVTKRRDSIYQEYFKVTQQGYMVIHMQSKKFQQYNQKDQPASDEISVRHRKVLGIYAEFSAIDIFEIKRLEESCNKKIAPLKIDVDTLTASFGLETVFTLLPTQKMKRDPEILESIHIALQELELEEVVDTEGFKATNPFYVRIRDILAKNVFISHFRSEEGDQLEYMVRNCLMQANEEQFATRDKLLDIGNSLKGCFSFIQVLSDQRDLDQYIDKCTPSVINMFNNCFEETQSTKAITSLQITWPEDAHLIVYTSNSYDISNEELTEFIQKDQKSEEGARLQAVTVQQIPVEWFKQNGSFLDFTMKLNEREMPDELYQSNFVKAIIEVYWKDIKRALIIWRVLPYFALCIIQMWHMFEVLSYHDMDEKKEHTYAFGTFLNITCLVLISMIVYFEVQQIRDKKSQYFSPWNINDWATIFLSLFVNISIMVHSELVSFTTLRIFASLVTLTLMIKIFDWLRIFDVTAFSVQLILSTIWDIKFFMVIFIYALLAFGIPMMFIELDHTHESVSANFWTQVLNKGIYSQYLLSLGEFNFDAWGDNSVCKAFMTVYFVFATFFTTLTMLNMLIAIMSDTFGKVYAKQDINAMKTKIGFISEIEKSFIVSTGKQGENEKNFIYVIRPAFVDLSQEGDLQEKTVSLLNRIADSVDKRSRTIETNVDNLGKEVTRRIDNQDAKLAEIMGALKLICTQTEPKDQRKLPKNSLTSILEVEAVEMDSAESVDLSAEEYDEVQVDE